MSPVVRTDKPSVYKKWTTLYNEIVGFLQRLITRKIQYNWSSWSQKDTENIISLKMFI